VFQTSIIYFYRKGFLYGFTDQKRIYCINEATGQTAWVDNAVNSDFATIVDCGSVLIGLPATANLIIMKPQPTGYSEIKKYKVSDTPIYTYPVISGDKIYIKDAENLIMFNYKPRRPLSKSLPQGGGTLNSFFIKNTEEHNLSRIT
jgi:hypothetical protein